MIRSLILLLLLAACGKPITVEESRPLTKNRYEEGVSEEILLDTRMSLNFHLLPLKGNVRKRDRFWSGDSWRLSLGSINYRWNSPDKEGFNYLSPTGRQVFSSSLKDLKTLSPSEKYDLWQGRYDYPLKNQVDLEARLGSLDWEGLCHGWAGASMNHDEPSPKVVTNPDGMKIPFGSSDIKGLLSYAYSKLLIREEEALGKRCEEQDHDEDFCNNDLTPESFHIVITNKIGLRGQSVIADMDRYKEVWNHPVTAYKATIEKMVTTPTGRKVVLETKLTYVDVVLKNSWEKHPAVYSYMTVRYELSLDKNGNITGGRWLSRERPDFLWTIPEAEKFEGYLAGVLELLK